MATSLRFRCLIRRRPRLIGWLLLTIIVGAASSAFAHTVVLTRARLIIAADGAYRLTIDCDLPAYLMQARPGHLDRELAEEFRTLPDADLEGALADARQSLRQRIRLDFGGQVSGPETIVLPAADQLRTEFKPDAVQLFVVAAAGTVPPGARHFTVTFPADLESVALVVDRSGAPPEHQLLRDGATSDPIPIGDEADRSDHSTSWLTTAWEYLALGFLHILPEGPDHVLFVLGLFLLSPRLKPLLWQVTAFTVAHSITLILSSYQKISLPASVVEPLIAVSISLIALENVFTSGLGPWRVLVVFGCGLLHGLGFAGVLEEAQLPASAFLTALLSFNVGVELGQLAVIALAMLTVGWFRERTWYRQRVSIPASCLIALIGFYWTIQRLGL